MPATAQSPPRAVLRLVPNFKPLRTRFRILLPSPSRSSNPMRLCVVGAGYVGLVTGACFADFGHSVVCVDSDRTKIDMLRNGDVPIFEPGLEALISNNVNAERLSFSTDLAASVRGADALFIAVGTPSRDTDGWPDLSSIFAVARDAARWLEDDAVVVVKSTVPIGTGDEVERIIGEIRPDASIN